MMKVLTRVANLIPKNSMSSVLEAKKNSRSKPFRWIKEKSCLIPLVDQWLLREIIPPLIFGISAFTVLSLSLAELLELIRKIISHNLPIITATEILLFRLPGYLVLAFPMATLLGCLIAFSKLSSNSEIKALLSLGFSYRRIIASALFVGIFMSIITFVFNNSKKPVLEQAIISAKDLP